MKTDSDRFMEAYGKGMEGMHTESVGFNCKCQDCLDTHGICCEHKAKVMHDNDEVIDEGIFSNLSCDICGSWLSGPRYVAHALANEPEKKISEHFMIHLEICQDCMLYMSNDDLPDVWE